MQNLKQALTECKKKYSQLCLIKDITKAEALFATDALGPLMEKIIDSTDQQHGAFKNDVARKMIISILEDIRMEIYHGDSSSDTTITAAKHLLEIAISEQIYKDMLNKILIYVSDYGYSAIHEYHWANRDDDTKA